MLIVIVVIAIGLLIVLVDARRAKPGDDQRSSQLAATAAHFGLNAVAGGFEGQIDGRPFSLHESRTQAFNRHGGTDAVFAPSPATQHYSRRLTACVGLVDVPPQLALGPAQPLLRNRAAVDDDEFERRFAVRQADPAIIGWLDERRRRTLTDAGRLVWIIDSTMIVHLGRLDEDDPQSTVRSAVAFAVELDGAGPP